VRHRAGLVQLVLYRAIQGIGGGGLMVLSQAIIGDVVTPRERGKYQGAFGAVFGVSSVAGPVLGGFFVDKLSWRWVFYVNIPIGIVALIVVAIVLPKTMVAARPIIDYAGIALLAGAATCVVLVTSFAGSVWPWDSAQVIAGIVGFLVFVVGFILVEQRVREPVMPLRLFRNRVFSSSSVIGFVVGFAMFGAITFLPLYMQRVQGVSATESGLRLLPTMGGLLLTSLASGQIISRTGRYKLFPILGCGCFTVGLFLLSRMDRHTGVAASSLYMFVLGVGLGMVMQVLVLAVQNASGWNRCFRIGVPAARGSVAHGNPHQRPRRGVWHPNVAHVVGRAAASAVSAPQPRAPIARLRDPYPTGERRSWARRGLDAQPGRTRLFPPD
jgi:predicted MFS family arabinose efflux permease